MTNPEKQKIEVMTVPGKGVVWKRPEQWKPLPVPGDLLISTGARVIGFVEAEAIPALLAALLEHAGAVKVAMVGVAEEGVTFTRNDDRAIEYEPHGYWLLPIPKDGE